MGDLTNLLPLDPANPPPHLIPNAISFVIITEQTPQYETSYSPRLHRSSKTPQGTTRKISSGADWLLQLKIHHFSTGPDRGGLREGVLRDLPSS
jgi:hypothetical protein